MSTVTTERNGANRATAILFAVIAAVYLCFLTKNYYWDGITFAHAIEAAPKLQPSLVHPNHLIYNFVGYVFYKALQAIGLNLRAVTALQILNSLCGALAAVLFFRTLNETLRSIYYAITLTLLFAFSATWWKYSTDADAYILSVLFLLLSFYLVLPWRKSRPILVALVYALSLCLHQMAIVFFPVLVVAIFVQDEPLPRRRRFLNCVTFSILAGALTLGVYIYSFYSLTGGFRVGEFFRWCLSYSPDESFGFHPWTNLGFTLRGQGRLFFGGRINALSGLINPFIVLLLILWVGLFLMLVVKVARSIKNPGWEWFGALKQDRERMKLAKLSLLWIAAYVIALYIFIANQTFYRLFYLPALILLIGLILESYQRVTGSSRKYRLAIFVAVVTVTNFLTAIFPFTHVEKFPPLALALEMNQLWPAKTIIYYGSANADNNLVRYFNPGTIWKKLEHKEQVEQELQDARVRGTATWLETSAIDQLNASADGTEWLKRHQKAATQRALITKAHNIRFVQVYPTD